MSSGNLNIKALFSFVTASIFSGCIIPPLFEAFWRNSADRGIGLWDAYQNSLYMNAAVGNRNWLSYVVLTMVICIVTIGPFVLFLYFWTKGKTEGTRKKKAESGGALRTVLMAAIVPLLAVNLLFGGIVVNYAYSDLQLNASFEQYLAALGPSLSDAEIRQLRSSWALMSSEEDCRKIFEVILSKSESAGIRLPQKLYF